MDGLNMKAKKRRQPWTANENDKDFSAIVSAHPYLQHTNDTLTSTQEISSLSQKRRHIWNAFLKAGLAPAKYSDMEHDLHSYFVLEVISDPQFSFLLICNDMEWKLSKWAQNAYSL